LLVYLAKRYQRACMVVYIFPVGIKKALPNE